ncbi:MAG: hypothetical protein ACI9WU_001095 [Myxococcota bacterium]|jgi:hypothetical protein
MEATALSALIDRLAGGGPRDEAFVRAFSAWIHTHRRRIRLPLADGFALEDVVVTFQMKQRVTLMVTGYPRGLPGDATLRVDEREFPFVQVHTHPQDQPDPYEICTLDYSLAGRRVAVGGGPHDGCAGAIVAAATVNGREEHRIRLDGGSVVTVSGEHVLPVG